jgi:competence protein ComEA
MNREQQGVVLFLSLLLTVLFLLIARPFPPSPAVSARERVLPPAGLPAEEAIWVEVDGAVRNRGIYSFEKGKSAAAAVERAGGASGNLGLHPGAGEMKIEKSGLLRVGGEEPGRPRLAPFEPAKMKVLSIPVNLNTAGVEELDILPGVGPKTAQAIIDFREAHGRFSSLEDLQKVKGLGPKKLAAIRPHVTLAD